MNAEKVLLLILVLLISFSITTEVLAPEITEGTYIEPQSGEKIQRHKLPGKFISKKEPVVPGKRPKPAKKVNLSQYIGKKCTWEGKGFFCQKVTDCPKWSGISVPGYCPGPAQIQCCVHKKYYAEMKWKPRPTEFTLLLPEDAIDDQVIVPKVKIGSKLAKQYAGKRIWLWMASSVTKDGKKGLPYKTTPEEARNDLLCFKDGVAFASGHFYNRSMKIKKDLQVYAFSADEMSVYDYEQKSYIINKNFPILAARFEHIEGNLPEVPDGSEYFFKYCAGILVEGSKIKESYPTEIFGTVIGVKARPRNVDVKELPTDEAPSEKPKTETDAVERFNARGIESVLFRKGIPTEVSMKIPKETKKRLILHNWTTVLGIPVSYAMPDEEEPVKLENKAAEDYINLNVKYVYIPTEHLIENEEMKREKWNEAQQTLFEKVLNTKMENRVEGEFEATLTAEEGKEFQKFLKAKAIQKIGPIALDIEVKPEKIEWNDEGVIEEEIVVNYSIIQGGPKIIKLKLINEEDKDYEKGLVLYKKDSPVAEAAENIAKDRNWQTLAVEFEDFDTIIEEFEKDFSNKEELFGKDKSYTFSAVIGKQTIISIEVDAENNLSLVLNSNGVTLEPYLVQKNDDETFRILDWVWISTYNNSKEWNYLGPGLLRLKLEKLEKREEAGLYDAEIVYSVNKKLNTFNERKKEFKERSAFNVKEQIKKAYEEKPFTYLLIVGSEDYIPLVMPHDDITNAFGLDDYRKGIVKGNIVHQKQEMPFNSFDSFWSDIDNEFSTQELAVGRIPLDSKEKVEAFLERNPSAGEIKLVYTGKEKPETYKLHVFGSSKKIENARELNEAIPGSRIFSFVSAEYSLYESKFIDLGKIVLKTDDKGKAIETYGSENVPDLSTENPIVIGQSHYSIKYVGKDFIEKGASAFLGFNEFAYLRLGFESPLNLKDDYPIGKAVKEFNNKNSGNTLVYFGDPARTWGETK